MSRLTLQWLCPNLRDPSVKDIFANKNQTPEKYFMCGGDGLSILYAFEIEFKA